MSSDMRTRVEIDFEADASALRAVKSAMEDVTSAAETAAPALEGTQRAAEKLGAAEEAQIQTAAQLNASLDDMGKTLRVVSGGAAASRQSLEETRKAEAAAASESQKRAAALEKERQKTEELARAERQRAREVKNLTELSKKLGTDMAGAQAFRTAHLAARQEKLTFSGAFDTARGMYRADFDQAAKLQQAAAPLLAFSKSIQSGLKDLVAAGASLDAALGDAAWRSGLGQAELAEAVRSASGGVAGRLELAQAADAFGRASLGDAVKNGTLAEVARLSAVSGIGAPQAAAMVAEAVNATGERDAKRMALILGASGDSAALAGTLARSGARARTLGWGAADLGAVSEALRAGGIGGERQSAAIGSIVEALGTPDRKRRGALRQLGVQRGMDAASTIGAIADRYAEADEKQKKRLDRSLRRAFGESGMAAVKALVDKVDVLRASAKKFADAKALSEAMDEREKSTDGAARAFQELSAALSDLKSSITQETLGIFSGAARALAAVVRGLTRLNEAVPALSVVAIGAAAGVGVLSLAVGGLMAAGGAAMSLLAIVKSIRVLIALRAPFVAMTAAMQTAAVSALASLKTYALAFGTAAKGAAVSAFASLKAGALSFGAAAKSAVVAAAPVAVTIAAVAVAADLVAKNFEGLKGTFWGLVGMVQTGLLKLVELADPLLALAGIDTSGIRESLKASALENLRGGADSLDTWMEATGGGDPMKVFALGDPRQTWATIDQIKARKEAERQAVMGEAPDGRLAVDVSVSDDRVRATVRRQGSREIQVGASNGLVIAGAV